jgi:hypothetical protein
MHVHSEGSTFTVQRSTFNVQHSHFSKSAALLPNPLVVFSTVCSTSGYLGCWAASCFVLRDSKAVYSATALARLPYVRSPSRTPRNPKRHQDSRHPLKEHFRKILRRDSSPFNLVLKAGLKEAVSDVITDNSILLHNGRLGETRGTSTTWYRNTRTN